MFSIILVVIVFFLSFFWLLFRRDSKDKFNIPGVTASHPELGNLGDLHQTGSLHQYLCQLHQRFGSIASFYWGKDLTVSLASPEAFHDTRHLFDRPVSFFTPVDALLGPNNIQHANGDAGRYRRKHHFDAAVSPLVIREHVFDIFQSILHEKIISWQSKEGTPIALHAEMVAAAFQPITVAVSGSSTLLNAEAATVDAFEACFYEMELILHGAPINPKRQAHFENARSHIVQKVKQLIAERRQRLGDDRKCFIDFLLADEDNVVSEEQICDDVIGMVVAGFHTISSLLTWTLYYLAKHQDIQQHLFEELVQSYDTEFPSMKQIDEMSYLSSIIDESLRVSVLTPWSARVSLNEELVVCGRTIPAGTPIIQALGVVLQDEKIWSNPHEFNPDRFNHENKKKLPKFAFVPFGFAGKRGCPGSHYAHYETSVFIAAIVRVFQISLVDPTSAVVPVYGLVTIPKDEIFARFNRRN